MGLNITPLIVVKKTVTPSSNLPAGPGYLVNAGDYFLPNYIGIILDIISYLKDPVVNQSFLGYPGGPIKTIK